MGHSYTDALTGHIMARERPYEPVRARWLASESWIYQVSMNLFVYASNSPTRNIDPSGREAKSTGKPSISDCLAKCNKRDCNGCCADVDQYDQFLCLLNCSKNLPRPEECGKCIIELWCWPAYGITAEAVHCEFWIRKSDFRTGRCSTGWQKCALPVWRELLYPCSCPLGCTGGSWKRDVPEKPAKAGAYVAQTIAYADDSKCRCLYDKCTHYPRSTCFNVVPTSGLDGNSNTATSCVERKCDLGFAKPENAIGWDQGGCPDHGWETTDPYD